MKNKNKYPLKKNTLGVSLLSLKLCASPGKKKIHFVLLENKNKMVNPLLTPTTTNSQHNATQR
jgi:hypothetical protein